MRNRFGCIDLPSAFNLPEWRADQSRKWTPCLNQSHKNHPDNVEFGSLLIFDFHDFIRDSVKIQSLWGWEWFCRPEPGVVSTCQQPGSPGCPQQFCLRATRLHKFRINLVSFSGKGIGWSRLVRKFRRLPGPILASSIFWRDIDRISSLERIVIAVFNPCLMRRSWEK